MTPFQMSRRALTFALLSAFAELLAPTPQVSLTNELFFQLSIFIFFIMDDLP